MRIFISMIFLWAIFIVAGCNTNFDTINPLSGIASTPSDVPLFTPRPVITTQGEIMISSTPDDASGLENLVDMAKNDLAQRLSISADEISLLEAKSVVWPDSSLGCPNPSLMYLQVLTPGYLIRLKALGQEYEFHTDKGRQIIQCDNASPPIPGTYQDR